MKRFWSWIQSPTKTEEAPWMSDEGQITMTHLLNDFFELSAEKSPAKKISTIFPHSRSRTRVHLTTDPLNTPTHLLFGLHCFLVCFLPCCLHFLLPVLRRSISTMTSWRTCSSTSTRPAIPPDPDCDVSIPTVCPDPDSNPFYRKNGGTNPNSSSWWF